MVSRECIMFIPGRVLPFISRTVHVSLNVMDMTHVALTRDHDHVSIL